MKNDDPRINELTIALQKAEQKLAEREALITTAFRQTEEVRSQYEQANERAEALRRRLDAKEEQLSALQTRLEAAATDPTTSRDQRIESLQRELRQRDERIAALEQLYAENDNALNAINQDVKRQNFAVPSEQVAAMGLALKSLDEPGLHHRIAMATTTLGRAIANDIAINSTSVSRYHARIVVESGEVYLVDLQSTNGCSVNGKRISRQIVVDRDVIAIGDAKFRLTVGVPSAEIEDRSMDETQVALDDAAISSAVPRAKTNSAQERDTRAKAKTK